MCAPVTVIAAHDLAFAKYLPWLHPQADARPWFADPGVAEETAFRNGTLGAAYLILAARALGLDAGPMSGFKQDVADAAFLAGTTWRSNFLINLGYGDRSTLGPRAERLSFEEACRLE